MRASPPHTPGRFYTLLAADGLPEAEDFIPGIIALADECFVVGLRVFLQVDGEGAARVFLQERHRLRTALEGVARVELHHDLRASVAEECVPGQLAIQW